MSGPYPLSCPAFPDDFLQRARWEVRCRTAPHQAVQRSQLALLLERVTFDPQTRALKLDYRLSPKQGRRWRPHGEETCAPTVARKSMTCESSKAPWCSSLR